MLKSFRANKKKSRHINNGIKQVLVTYQAKHSGDGQETYFCENGENIPLQNETERNRTFCSRSSNVKRTFIANATGSFYCPVLYIALYCMNLVILSWMKISVLRCTSSTKAKGNCVEMNCILFFYIESAWLDERRKKEEKESDENWSNWDY